MSMLQGLDSGRQDTIMNSITHTGNKITESATAIFAKLFLKAAFPRFMDSKRCIGAYFFLVGNLFYQ